MTYQTIDNFLLKSDFVNSAAEAHGMAAGMLCANRQTRAGVWIKLLFENDSSLNVQETQALQDLFEEAKESLSGEEYDFELFLPGDDTPLSAQISALSDWCQGFLYGIGALYQARPKNGQIDEILRDIAEFTKLDPDAAGEENEVAFMEVTEYLRAAVLLLHAESGSEKRARIH